MTTSEAPSLLQSPTRRRQRGRRRVLVGLALLAVAVVAAVLAFNPETMRPGPLTTPDPGVDSGHGLPNLRVGDLRCYGYVSVNNPTSTPATIDRVDLHDVEGVEVGDITVLPANRAEFLYATAETCPHGAPAAGSVVPPDSQAPNRFSGYGVEILVSLRLAAVGEHRISGMSIYYSHDGRHFRLDQQSDVVMCSTSCVAAPVD